MMEFRSEELAKHPLKLMGTVRKLETACVLITWWCAVWQKVPYAAQNGIDNI